MKVLYDYQGFMQRHGGVSRYFVELTRAMEKTGDFKAVIPAFFTDNQYLEHTRALFTRRPFKGKTRLMAVLNRRMSVRSLRGTYDLFHPTYFQTYFLSRLRSPFVVTVHDMTHELFGGDYVRDDGTRQNARLLCARAAGIIAVSQSTKNDLCSLLHVDPGKVTVVHHGTTLQYDGSPRVHRHPYLLYVGDRDGYKNFGPFLSSVAGLLKTGDLQLLAVGSRPFSGNERGLMERQGVSDRVLHVEISGGAELSSLYHFASAFCYPSLHEGFGLPLLEAFACGCPVAASSTSSIPEVAGDAAEYFDPRDAASMTAAVEKVVFDPARARGLVEKGAHRLGLYSWAKAAASTLEVYRAAL